MLLPAVLVNKTKYYYELHGDQNNQPLVLTSGLWSDHSYWEPILPQLARDFYVLIFDNRAIGNTVDDGSSFSIEEMADDTMLLIQNVVNHAPVNLIGQSMGGSIVQAVAACYPDRIKKLVLLNTTPRWRQASIEALRSVLLSYKENASFEQLFSSTLAWLYGEDFLSNKAKVKELRDLLKTTKPNQTLNDQERQFYALERFKGVDFSKLVMPTFVGYGEEDKLSPPIDSKVLGENIIKSQLHCFPGAHRTLYEACDELTQALLSFIKEETRLQ